MKLILAAIIAVLVVLALLIAGPANAGSSADRRYDNTRWIKLWTKRDHSWSESLRVASATYKVSLGWLQACNGDEGGNIARWKLAITIKSPWQLGRGGGGGVGWNNIGSYAFGPMQFMLDAKPPSGPHQWGTFGEFVWRAFREARRRGVNIPYRFARPDSLVGQAFTAAFAFATGYSTRWSGAGCN